MSALSRITNSWNLRSGGDLKGQLIILSSRAASPLVPVLSHKQTLSSTPLCLSTVFPSLYRKCFGGGYLREYFLQNVYELYIQICKELGVDYSSASYFTKPKFLPLKS